MYDTLTPYGFEVIEHIRNQNLHLLVQKYLYEDKQRRRFSASCAKLRRMGILVKLGSKEYIDESKA